LGIRPVQHLFRASDGLWRLVCDSGVWGCKINAGDEVSFLIVGWHRDFPVLVKHIDAFNAE
jgi:hypothetical protein